MFSPYDKQFLITESLAGINRSALANMSSHQLGRWRIAHGAHISLHPIVADDGQVRGCVIGWLEGDGVGRLGNFSVFSAPVRRGAEDVDAMLLRWSESLAGKYVILYEDREQGARVLGDPAGALGAVYPTDRAAVASSPVMFIERDGELSRNPINDAICSAQAYWYPFGMTPWAGIARLLPSHILDLDRGRAYRAWPSAAIAASFGQPDAPTDQLMGQIRSDALADVARFFATDPNEIPVVHLTGGADSRMSLALCLAMGREFTTMTLAMGAGESRDVRIARKLARQVGVAHEVRRVKPITESDAQTWVTATGGTVLDAVAGLPTTQRLWSPNERQLSGVGGEVARAFYWRRSDMGRQSVSADTLVARLRQPQHPAVLDAAESWLGNLPPMRATAVLDLAYIEQRLGCWAGPPVYGGVARTPVHSPFGRRSIFTNMLRLPERYRFSQRFVHDFIAALEPGLVALPFNRLAGLAALGDPKSLARTLLPYGAERALKPALKRVLDLGRSRPLGV